MSTERADVTARSSSLRGILSQYGVSYLSEDVARRILAYTDLLKQWSKRISLTTVTKDEEIFSFHFGESAFALNFVEMTKGRLADVGSGAGFPGLALKMFRSELEVFLIEPNRKKCAFLHEVVRTLDLKHVEILSSAYAESEIPSKSLDFVTSRALGDRKSILRWCERVLRPSAQVILWLGADDLAELSEAPGWHWNRTQQIPITNGRFIVFGAPSGDSIR